MQRLQSTGGDAHKRERALRNPIAHEHRHIIDDHIVRILATGLSEPSDEFEGLMMAAKRVELEELNSSQLALRANSPPRLDLAERIRSGRACSSSRRGLPLTEDISLIEHIPFRRFSNRRCFSCIPRTGFPATLRHSDRVQLSLSKNKFNLI